MAFSNSTSNVKGPLICAIALGVPAASPFTTGVEIGMKKPSKLMVTQESTQMSSGNAYPDCFKVSIETSGIQNDFATLAAVNGYAENFCQAVMQTAGGDFGSFLGADSDSETLMGLEWEWTFKANEDEIKYKLMTEVSDTAWNALWGTSAGTSTWTSGVDASKRSRPGVKNVTFGGVTLGNLLSVEGSVKSHSITVQNGRSLSNGVEASVKIVLAQTAKAEVTAALLASKGSDTMIVNFWGGARIFKMTNVLAGKAFTMEKGEKDSITIEAKAFFPKGSTRIIINTVPGTFELVFLDNLVAP
jgi:hypothetical protein